MTALAHNILAHETVIARPFNVTGPKELIMNPAFMAPVGAIRNAKETFDIYLSQTQDANDGPKSATSNFLSLLKQILNI